MRKIIFSLLSIMLIVGSINAQGSGIGVGLSWEGLSVKYWMNENTALSAHLSNSKIGVDYLLHKPDMLKLTEAPTPVYYGAGGVLGSHEDWDAEDLEYNNKIDLGLRGVIGLSYYVSAYPIDIYIEESPAFYLLGGKGLDLINLTFGFRYFF